MSWIAVVALLVLGTALRWASIHQSLFGDELFLYSRVHGQSFGHMLSLVHDNENTPPLFFIVAWVFARGSHAMVLVRIPSLIANVALIGLVFVLGRRVFGTVVGLIGAAWFALSPFQIFYGTEDRAYSAVALLVVISTLALLAALEGSPARAGPGLRRQRRWWVIYLVLAVAAIYTHYIAVMVLAPQALWGLWRYRETLRRQLVWHGLVIACVVPWIPFFVLQARHSARESVRLSGLAPLTPSTAVKTEAQSLFGHPFIPPGRLPGVVAAAALGALLLVVIVLIGRRWSALPGFLRTGRGLVALLAICPIVLLVIYSLRPHTSLLLPRNIEVGAPYAAVVIGWLLTRWPLRWSIALSLVAFAALLVGTVKIMSAAYQRPDGRSAARLIDARAAPNAAVLDFPGPQGTQFYFRRVHRLSAAATFSWVAAAGAGQQVFLTYLTNAPCLRNPPMYRLVAQRSWPSVPLRLAVCEYAPGAR